MLNFIVSYLHGPQILIMSSSKFSVKQCKCPLFGRPVNSSDCVLPTYKTVILCYLETRCVLGKLSKCNKELKFSEIAEKVALKIIALFEQVSIPHVTETRVINMINLLHD